ncbi:MAG: dihydrofolate reductase [Bradyrhizobium sp.]|nr:MAG: dihydrofolate reductase [Bradyrhizobium sp.]
MSDAFRYEAYVIASADGMIADANGHMPEALVNRADQRFFNEALERAAVLVHGRNSHEGQANSNRRRRVVVTSRTATVAADPEHPHAVFWNPQGAPFSSACAALGVDGGVAAILGGPEVYRLFLKLGYWGFHLSRATRLRVPGGLPVFGRDSLPVEAALSAAGLTAGPERWLDEKAAVSLSTWSRPAA